MAKKISRAEQAEITKKKIYNCGVKLIRKYGFDQVTVEQISKKAGVSVGTYYYYFESKYELFSEIFKRGDEFFLKEVEGKLEASDCRGQIIEYFDKYADFAMVDGVEFAKKLYVPDNKMFITKGRAMQKVLQTIIEQWQEKGELLNSESSEEITRMLFVVARGVIYDWCLYDGENDLKDEMSRIMARTIEGFLLRK